MKRKLSMLLAIAMLFCFVLSGCGEQAEDPVDSSAPSESGDAADGSSYFAHETGHAAHLDHEAGDRFSYA